VIPPEISLNKTTLTVIDSQCTHHSDRSGSETDFSDELAITDCVLVVYDVSKPATEESLLAHWLPLITQTTSTPIILVGNKLDLGRRTRLQEELIRELQVQFPSVQLAIELSTKDVSRVGELFEYAETLVLYPAAPLFDVATQRLTPSFTRALKLIFRLADSDDDGVLSDAELQALNVTLDTG
jgi:GTPase SAR1 family protein